MARPKGHGPLTLSPTDPAYESHRERIASLDERAKRLFGIYEESRGHIFVASTTGYGKDIICDRENGDELPSVSRLYFGAAIRVKRDEDIAGNNPTNFPEDLVERRELVEETLAAHLSVNRHMAGLAVGLSADETMDEYLRHIRGLEKFCKTNGLTSLLPNVFLHTSLASQLHTSEYLQAPAEIRMKLFDRVLGLSQCQPQHLCAFVTPFFQEGSGEYALELLGKVCAWRSITIADFCVENIALAHQCAKHYYDCGRYADVIALAGKMDLRGIPKHVAFFEVFLHACTDAGDFAAAKACIEKHNLRIKPGHPGLCTAIQSACESIAYWMQGEGLYQDGMHFLTTYAGHDLAIEGSPIRIAYGLLEKTLNMPKKKAK